MKRFSLLAIILILAACATSPTGRNQLILVGDEQMQKMGISSFQQIKSDKKISNNLAQQEYVACVAENIIEALPEQWANRSWEVVVFDDDSANAFALPGGKIGVHSGLLTIAETPSQLAAVIGHEIAHVLARHGAERVSLQVAAQTGMQVADIMARQHVEGSTEQQILMAGLGIGTQVGVLLPFSRTHESEADQYGLNLMARAGFDPAESIQLWQNMDKASKGQRPPEFLSTHPEPENRIEALRRYLPEAQQLQQQAINQGRRPNCRL
ncbi:MAG: M48 family peptidase [Proteobacteria bacterium]|nr:MAG: M48 family peptidase [Pseudomonadota bacterium]